MGLQSKSLVSIGKEMLLEVSLFEIFSARNISDSKYLHFGRESAVAPGESDSCVYPSIFSSSPSGSSTAASNIQL